MNQNPIHRFVVIDIWILNNGNIKICENNPTTNPINVFMTISIKDSIFVCCIYNLTKASNHSSPINTYMNFESLLEQELIQLKEQIKLSKVEKLDGIYSWSLPAGKTCPGAIDPKTKKIVPSCIDCYAKKGSYRRFPAVNKAREFNKKDWKREDWEEDMIDLLDNMRFFRWFDSGDVYHPKLAEKIYNVMKATHGTKHWIPTRSFNIRRIMPWLHKMEALHNVVVRKSSGSIEGECEIEGHGSTIYSDEKQLPKDVIACPVGVELDYTRKGEPVLNKRGEQALRKSCKKCRACWDKDTKQVAYIKH